MYKLLIVEDERIIRNSLVQEIPWEKVGGEMIGEAADGLMGFQMVTELKPDIVISDIKMERMDGIELCERIKSSFPGIKLIIITGYGEFAYAQTAVKLGVKDFILKPTDPNELMAAVEKAAAELEAEVKKKQEIERLQQLIESNIPALREKFLQDLLTEEGISQPEFAERLEFLGIEAGEFYLVCIGIDDYNQYIKNNSEKERQVNKLVIKRIGQQIIDQYAGGYIFDKESNLFVALIYKSPYKDIYDLAEEIQQEVFAYLSLPVSLGISLVIRDFFEYREAFSQACEALQYKFYLGEKTIAFFGDINYSNSVSNHNLFQKTRIVNSLRVGDCNGALEQLKSDLSKIEDEMVHDVLSIRNAAIELVILIQGVLLDKKINHESLDLNINYYEAFLRCNTLEEVEGYLKEYINKTAMLIQNENIFKNSAAVNKILEYLNANYDNSIALDDLARLVYMNPKYICRLIKKETGRNFLDILNEIRIDKAKEFITDPKYKTYEIAQMVGINDAKYFSQIFKKITGMTPTEYREKL